jgi:hypothetical protein
VKKLFIFLLSTVCCNLALPLWAQKSLDAKIPVEDVKAIKALAGYYKVTFDYSETFSPDTVYHFHPKYHSYGYEWVFVAEEKPGLIVLQHMLAMDTMVIKHWREDWVYQNRKLLSYQQNDTWTQITLTPAQAKGSWTQQVYQVDDSPRYAGYGTWVHADGRHFWLSEADSPLPRREFTKRSDYNVLHRRNLIQLTNDGWMFEQDNQKIVRSEAGDKLLAWEKGFEKFEKSDEARFDQARQWWEAQKGYWADVRNVWAEISSERSQLSIQKKVDDKRLYEQLFALGDEWVKNPSQASKATIRQTIEKYLKKN